MWITDVMEKMKKVNLSMPPAVADAMDAEAKAILRPKQKWELATAGVVLLLQLSRDEREAIISRVHQASGVTGSFEALLKEPPSLSPVAGELRKSASVNRSDRIQRRSSKQQ